MKDARFLVPDQPIQNARVYVPRQVELGDGRLHWSYEPIRERRVGTGMLQRFIELHRLSDEEILKYARDWGVFGLCAHGLPASHSETPMGRRLGIQQCEWVPSASSERFPPPQFSWIHPGLFCEDLAHWRRFSEAADAAIQLAAKLNHRRFDDSDPAWSLLLSQYPSTPNFEIFAAYRGMVGPPKYSDLLRAARFILALDIETWLAIGKAGLGFKSERDGSWRIEFASRAFPNLFGILAMKLMFAVAENDRVVFCATCSRPYWPNKRRPAAGRANYCDDCKKNGTMWREIKRRQRKED